MNTTLKLTTELYNLLTLPYDDQMEDYTYEDIIEMIKNAANSVGL